MARREYTTVSVTPEGAEALRRLSYMVSATLGQRVTLSDTIRIAEKIVFAHDLSIAEQARGVVE